MNYIVVITKMFDATLLLYSRFDWQSGTTKERALAIFVAMSIIKTSSIPVSGLLEVAMELMENGMGLIIYVWNLNQRNMQCTPRYVHVSHVEK